MAPRGRQRAPTNWGGVVASTFTSVPALTKVLLTFISPEFVSGETIRRFRGTLFVAGSSATSYHGAIGAFVAGNNAITAGVASLIDPVTDVSDDAWMWYQSFSGAGTAVITAGPGGTNQLIPIDSKAMRRVETGYAIAFVVANASATTNFVVALSLRALGSESS